MRALNLSPLFVAGLLSTCGAPAPAQAQYAPTTIGMHMFSVHTHKVDVIAQKDWNNLNPGMYAKWDNGLVIGGYYNSIRRTSFYVGYAYPLTDNFDVVVGAITGYYGDVPTGTYGTRKVLPLIVPSYHFRLTDDVVGRVHFIPKTGKYAAAAFHFSIEKRF